MYRSDENICFYLFIFVLRSVQLINENICLHVSIDLCGWIKIATVSEVSYFARIGIELIVLLVDSFLHEKNICSTVTHSQQI